MRRRNKQQVWRWKSGLPYYYNSRQPWVMARLKASKPSWVDADHLDSDKARLVNIREQAKEHEAACLEKQLLED